MVNGRSDWSHNRQESWQTIKIQDIPSLNQELRGGSAPPRHNKTSARVRLKTVVS